MSDSAFSGFPKDFFQFFRELEQHNERSWFEDNRDRYKASVEAPMLAFIGAMQPRLAEVSTHFRAIPKVNGGSMFRIYRDVRFSKDKRPYKTHGACHFRHELGKDAHAPGFYVHLEPGRVFMGGGIWRPPGPALRTIRETIADSPKAWGDIREDATINELFGGISGDQLKTVPRGFDRDEPHIEDLRRKSFYCMRELPQSAALKADFPEVTRDTFLAAAPLMRFVSYALDVPF